MSTNDSLMYRPTTISPTHQVLQYVSDGSTYHIQVAVERLVEGNVWEWQIAYSINGRWYAGTIPSTRRSIGSTEEAIALGFMWAESKVHRTRVAEMLLSPQSWEDRKYIICYLLKYDTMLKDKIYAVYPRSGQPYIQIVADKWHLSTIAKAIQPLTSGIEIQYQPK